MSDPTGGRKILRELYEQNLWANLRLLDHCEGLPDAAMDFELAGTYGTPRQTLVHLLAAEQRYVALLTGQDPEQPLRESDGFPGFDVLREQARRSGSALNRLADDLDVEATWTSNHQGKDWEARSFVVMIQAINHGTEHREQVKAALTHAGQPAPDIDGWSYGEAVGHIAEKRS